jgi:hypothetical protein
MLVGLNLYKGITIATTVGEAIQRDQLFKKFMMQGIKFTVYSE